MAKISSRNVHNYREHTYYGWLIKAAKAAKEAGYDFFQFNDIVYAVLASGDCMDTGMRKEDIEERDR